MPRTAVACTPLAPAVDAGFPRSNITHLPRNARGVIFLATSVRPEVSDFLLTSPDDPRQLALKLHSMPDGGQIRLEPVGGFMPSARYTFQYRPTHKKWRFPDQMTVVIDEQVAETAGTYAIELAPQPEVRMVLMPGSPACTYPAVALTQPFSYRVPEALASYRTGLEYGTRILSEPLGKAGKELSSYFARFLWRNPYRTDQDYTGADDAVIATCDQQKLRGELIGTVAFPEVDDHEYHLDPVTVDLGHNVLGECKPLDALTRTMQTFGTVQTLVIRAGSLPSDIRVRIASVARGRTNAAPHAQAILAALPTPRAHPRSALNKHFSD